MSVTIRPTVSSDLPAIAAIHAPYVRDTLITFEENPPTLADWQQKFTAISASGWPFLTATDDAGDVLGYAYLTPFRGKSGWRFASESSIYLAPEATGRGVGTQLLAELEDAGRTAGVRSIVAVVTDEGTEASLALHAKSGYVAAGHMPGVGWKFDRPVGVHFLVKHLAAVR